jgi:Uma2 family endonuclease
VSTQPKTFLTAAQYLEIERAAEYKSEYLDGEMFAMAGARRAHNVIVSNCCREMSHAFRHPRYEVYPGDMRVHVPATGLYTYPDVAAVCGEPEFLDEREDTLLTPTVLVEVLSPSTEGYDRGRKFGHYKTIPSLREYLPIASDRVHVDLYIRQSDGGWLLRSADRLEDTATLESVDASLKLADLYEKLEFPGRI